MRRASLVLCSTFALLVAPSATMAKDVPVMPSDLAHANFGPYPANYMDLIKSWAELKLKDPYSAKYVRTSVPRKEWAVANNQPIYGWSVCSLINSKNSYGGYTGVETFWFFIQDGKIVRSQDIDKPGGIPELGVVIPGRRISLGHDVNCDDGEAPPAAQ